MKKIITALILSLIFVGTGSAQTPQNDEETKGASGLPLPRFASLHADQVNLRTGPGTRYPIEWVYVRESLPVEITAESDIWRRVRDWEGSEGWVHKSALTGKRTVIVTGGTKDLLKEPSPESAVVAHLEQGAIGHVVSCQDMWCEIKIAQKKGYLSKLDVWGVYTNETID